MLGVRLKGNERIRRRLQGMQKRVEHDNPAMRASALIMWKDQVRHFKNERGPKGRWKRLKGPRKRGGVKVLQDTGFLRSSIRFRGIKHNAIVWTSLKYGKFHQFGTKRIPRRQFLWLSKEARKEAMRFISRFIVGR